VLLCTLGDPSSPAPMQFKFSDGDLSGWMAFTGPATSRLLLVTDAGHDAVHVIDVVGGVHVGYVAAPGAIAGPRGVAARGSLAAVSSWKISWHGENVVRLFEGSGASWTAVRVLAGGFWGRGSADGQLYGPFGLRFSGDGTELVVADADNHRVSMFRVEDGAFVRQVATGLSRPYDVEECEGGWLVACHHTHTVEFVSGGVDGGGAGRPRLAEWCHPSALALVPGLGLVVRDAGTASKRFQVFTSPAVVEEEAARQRAAEAAKEEAARQRAAEQEALDWAAKGARVGLCVWCVAVGHCILHSVGRNVQKCVACW
jgi:hypothetical protein